MASLEKTKYKNYIKLIFKNYTSKKIVEYKF